VRAVLRDAGGAGDAASRDAATGDTARTTPGHPSLNFDATDHLSVLVHGPPGCGASALTAEAASLVPFPSVRVFRADVAAASGADACLHSLRRAFDDAAKAKVRFFFLTEPSLIARTTVAMTPSRIRTDDALHKRRCSRKEILLTHYLLLTGRRDTNRLHPKNFPPSRPVSSLTTSGFVAGGGRPGDVARCPTRGRGFHERVLAFGG
jgi:hypothetical protein